MFHRQLANYQYGLKSISKVKPIFNWLLLLTISHSIIINIIRLWSSLLRLLSVHMFAVHRSLLSLTCVMLWLRELGWTFHRSSFARLLTLWLINHSPYDIIWIWGISRHAEKMRSFRDETHVWIHQTMMCWLNCLSFCLACLCTVDGWCLLQ